MHTRGPDIRRFKQDVITTTAANRCANVTFVIWLYQAVQSSTPNCLQRPHKLWLKRHPDLSVRQQARKKLKQKQHHATRCHPVAKVQRRSEEHTSELQSLMRISYAVFCLK